jgi:hypothetical protein
MGGIWDIGFIDPDKVNVESVEKPWYVKDTEELVLTCFKRQSTRKEILLPYNFG